MCRCISILGSIRGNLDGGTVEPPILRFGIGILPFIWPDKVSITPARAERDIELVEPIGEVLVEAVGAVAKVVDDGVHHGPLFGGGGVVGGVIGVLAHLLEAGLPLAETGF